MPVSDLDIHRSAHLFAQLHGDAATAKAREMVAWNTLPSSLHPWRHLANAVR